MSVPTAELTAPAVTAPARARAALITDRLGGGRFYLALGAVALVIGALSLLIPSTPSYDPWAWLVWGREIVHLKLHTTGGPSWKPLPLIFTTVFGLFGHAAPDLWLMVARAGAVVAVVMAFKIAWRVTRGLMREDAEGALWRLAPPLLAALIAAASIVNSRGFISDNALGYSEGLMAALLLVALDRHLDGARRQAFAVGFFAALDRPELWLLWGPYGLYLWWKDPGARRLVAALFALIPVLWFLPELWGSGHLFRGVTRAQHPRSNSPAFASCPFCTEFNKHAWPTVLTRVKAAGIAGMLVAVFVLWRTRARWWSQRIASPFTRALFALIACGLVGLGWWVGISLETQAGFSGNDRYLVLGVALVSVAGGVGWGWIAHGVALALRRVAGSVSVSGLGAGAVGLAAAIALFLAIPPWIGSNLINIQASHRALVYQAHLREDMAKAVSAAGGPARIRACGSVMTEGFQVPMLAWNLGVHTLQVRASPLNVKEPGPAPNVIFQTRAQRNASLLPVVRAWHGVHYTLVAHVRTFRVYASCADGVTL